MLGSHYLREEGTQDELLCRGLSGFGHLTELLAGLALSG